MEAIRISDVPQCRECGCTDTVARKAYREEIVRKDKGPDNFASASKLRLPLQDPSQVAIYVDVLIIHFDACLECGRWYCTRAEVVKAPISGMKSSKGEPR